MTPLGQPGFPPPLLGMPVFPPPFVPRSKRAPSMSVGGPPKAVLGGPQRKVSPNPGVPDPPQPAPTTKVKKHIVNLPKETVPAKGGDAPPTRSSWARQPLLPSDIPPQVEVPQPDTRTAEPYPPDNWRRHLPNTVDVFLPGKVRVYPLMIIMCYGAQYLHLLKPIHHLQGAWAEMKQKIIEEKLERLGVERGGSTSAPQIHAPHGRANSVSTLASFSLVRD